MEQDKLDLEIKMLRIDYDISAYRTSIIDLKRKYLEASKNLQNFKVQIAELEDKIAGKELEKESLG